MLDMFEKITKLPYCSIYIHGPVLQRNFRILPSLQVHSKLHQEQTEQHNQLRVQTWLEENFIHSHTFAENIWQGQTQMKKRTLLDQREKKLQCFLKWILHCSATTLFRPNTSANWTFAGWIGGATASIFCTSFFQVHKEKKLESKKNFYRNVTNSQQCGLWVWTCQTHLITYIGPKLWIVLREQGVPEH